MHHLRLQSALKNYADKKDLPAEELISLLNADEKGYTSEEVVEILDALKNSDTQISENEKIEPDSTTFEQKDLANTKFDEYRVKLESDGNKFTGATVMKKIAVRKIHPDNAKRLNEHAGNALTCYFPAGTYKASDEISLKTLREIAPGFNWGKASED